MEGVGDTSVLRTQNNCVKTCCEEQQLTRGSVLCVSHWDAGRGRQVKGCKRRGEEESEGQWEGFPAEIVVEQSGGTQLPWGPTLRDAPCPVHAGLPGAREPTSEEAVSTVGWV